MKNELFERELQNTSINDVSLADYAKDNYLPISVIDKMRAEIELLSNANPSYWHSGDMVEREEVFEIIDKYRGETKDADSD